MLNAFRIAIASLILVSIPFVAEAKEPKDGYFETSDGINIHYMTLGKKGSWVVLIHGYTDSANRMWFRTGVGQALAKNHRVVAIDNRNHGKSDKPEPRGSGKVEDVIELMDLLKIDKAHIHGYSMGGGITARLLATNPERFITAAFGGSGIYEDDEDLRAKAADRDPEMPPPEGFEAAAFKRLQQSAASRRTASGESSSARPATRTRARLEIDLTSVTIPVLAINGEFDRPYSKTQRLEREVPDFENVILPGKNHMSASGVGSTIPQQYTDSIVNFINENDS